MNPIFKAFRYYFQRVLRSSERVFIPWLRDSSRRSTKADSPENLRDKIGSERYTKRVPSLWCVSGWRNRERGWGVEEEMEGDDNATNNRKVVLGNNSSCGTNTSYPFLDSLFHASTPCPHPWLLPTDNTSFAAFQTKHYRRSTYLLCYLSWRSWELWLWKSTPLLVLAHSFHQTLLLTFRNSKR